MLPDRRLAHPNLRHHGLDLAGGGEKGIDFLLRLQKIVEQGRQPVVGLKFQGKVGEGLAGHDLGLIPLTRLHQEGHLLVVDPPAEGKWHFGGPPRLEQEEAAGKKEDSGDDAGGAGNPETPQFAGGRRKCHPKDDEEEPPHRQKVPGHVNQPVGHAGGESADRTPAQHPVRAMAGLPEEEKNPSTKKKEDG